MSNSLQSNLNHRDAINQIRLSLQSPIGYKLFYVLVEGVDDCKIYRKFFNAKTRVEFVHGGKGQVEKALNELNNIARQVIGICDADFRHLQKIASPLNNLFFTDFHDIEMTMLSVEGVLNDTLTEYGLENDTRIILEATLKEAVKIGYIRWYNEIFLTKLDFQGLGLGGFSNPHDIDICLDVSKYLYALNSRSKNKTKEITLADISQFAQKYHTEDIFNLCNGHEVINLMTLIIGHSTSPEKFSSVLRMAFNIHYFYKTKLYTSIVQFQIEHGFTILRS